MQILIYVLLYLLYFSFYSYPKLVIDKALSSCLPGPVNYIAFVDPASVLRIVNSTNKVIEGDQFVVTCEASGDPKLIIYWIKEDNNQRINGSILNFTSINRNDGGTYIREVENDCASDSRVEIINVSCKYINTYIQFLKLRNEQNPNQQLVYLF